jgi:predicted  nucleic acid-binding Zn-ribbon protein
MVWVGAVLAALAVLGIILAIRVLKTNRRDVALRDLLDGADALEEQLHECRERMKKLQSLLAQLPSDMTGSAMSSLDPEGQVRTALRDVLAHRLWIKQNGSTASQHELDQARDAIRKSREQLSEQLRKLDEVGQELAEAGATLKAAYSRSAPRVASGAPKNGRKLNGHATPDA